VLCVKIVRLRPAAKLLVPVNALNAAPFALPDTLEVGMLCPTPSVNAAVVLLVKAYNVMVNGGIEMTQEVVMAMLEFPEPTPLRGSVKFTFEGAAETVRVCARASVPVRHTNATPQIRENLLPRKFTLRGLRLPPIALLEQFSKVKRMMSIDRTVKNGKLV
jgi:hypothetical protein